MGIQRALIYESSNIFYQHSFQCYIPLAGKQYQDFFQANGLGQFQALGHLNSVRFRFYLMEQSLIPSKRDWLLHRFCTTIATVSLPSQTDLCCSLQSSQLGETDDYVLFGSMYNTFQYYDCQSLEVKLPAECQLNFSMFNDLSMQQFQQQGLTVKFRRVDNSIVNSLGCYSWGAQETFIELIPGTGGCIGQYTVSSWGIFS